MAFLKIFDAVTEQIKQAGKRRGANMAILNADHPDIVEFVNAKSDQKSLQNFNLSVGISDAFITALRQDGHWALKDPQTQEVVSEIEAKELWNLIIKNAWQTGDPGLIFLDRIERANPTPFLGIISSTNPCGEMPLLAYESCNLGSINLSNMTKGKSVNWEKLRKTVIRAIRFLDNVIQVNQYPFREVEELTKGNRKIGLGVMGWAEMLIKLKNPYSSDEAVDLAEDLMEYIESNAISTSMSLAMEKGPFANWPKSIFYPHKKMRNATVTSIAPTGTISIIADTSSSIEPLFKLAFKRESTLGSEHFVEINQLLIESLKHYHLLTDKVLEQIVTKGSLEGIDKVPLHLKELFKTAHEISPEYHIRHQVAFQKYTDNAVSKTINLPEISTQEEVESVFDRALESNLKGITVYRDGSKNRQVLSTIDTSDLGNYKFLIDNDCRLCEI